jgi:hypothetical protein
MIERLLKSKLEPVARRERQVRLWRSLAVCWAATALTGLFFLWLSSRFGISRIPGLAAIVLTVVAGLITTFVRWRRDERIIGRSLVKSNENIPIFTPF